MTLRRRKKQRFVRVVAVDVALNCVANGEILRDGAFKNLWVQPAAGDAGGALGAAQAVWYQELGNPRRVDEGKDGMRGAYLGPSYSDKEIQERLTEAGAVFTAHSEEQTILLAARALTEEKAVGWFSGRMEFGPRALGSWMSLSD